MTKYKFTAEHYDGSKVTYECEVDHISEVLQGIEYFLRGVGFCQQGTLDFIQHEDYSEPQETNFQVNQNDIDSWIRTQQHSEFYFDTERNK